MRRRATYGATDRLAKDARRDMANQTQWNRSEGSRRWLAESRLDGMTAAMLSIKDTDTRLQALVQRYRQGVGPAVQNLKLPLSNAGQA